MTPTAVDLSIVIPHWNTPDLLSRCVDAVSAACCRLRSETWVIDNGSNPESQPSAGVRDVANMVSNSRNLGFAAACNQGARLARGRYVLFLNSDAVVDEHCLDRLVSALDSDPCLAAVGPTVRCAGHGMSAVVSPARRWLGPWTQAVASLGIGGARRFGPVRSAGVQRAAWVEAAALLVHAARFRGLGGFDEGFFFYEEDEDFCWRAGRRGYGIGVCSDAVIEHRGGASTALAGTWPARELAAAQSRFVERRCGRSSRLVHDLAVRAVRGVKRLHARAVLGLPSGGAGPGTPAANSEWKRMGQGMSAD